MKSKWIAFIVIMIIASACKKQSQTITEYQPSVNGYLFGEWHYHVYDVKYYDSQSRLMYDDIATAQSLHADPYYTFYQNKTATLGDLSFNYDYRSNNGVDSLIFTGRIALGYKVMAIDNEQLQLQRVYHSDQEFVGPNGIVKSDFAISNGTFTRTQAP